MATYYLDLENGNDANDGTTFANRWKTFTNGATAARIAPGDTIRVMGSPDPTSLGINGTWTGGKPEAAFATPTLTNATPIVCTTATAHGYSTGDVVVVRAVTGNTNANGTWTITVTSSTSFELDGSSGNGTTGGSGRTVARRNRQCVFLASALTANIAMTGESQTVAWTASTNVTTSLSTAFYKEHRASQSIAIAAGFTTGKAAYYTLPSTLDLSSYQQVSLWLHQSAGTLSDTAYELRLCTDTTGDTSVHTIALPSPGSANNWTPVTVDLATNLNSAIKSIALYVNTDLGAATLLVDNIIACKASSSADSLTLHSLIGKNIAGDTFYGIQSINGTRVMLDQNTNRTPGGTSAHECYQGTSETVTTYKRETIKTARSAGNTINDNGTAGNLISFEGGWDRTDMSTQTLETWLDGQNGVGNGLSMTSSRSYLSFNKFALVRYSVGIAITNSASANIQMNEIVALNNNANSGLSSTASSSTYTNIKSASFNNASGLTISGSSCTFTTLGLLNSNNDYGLSNSGSFNTFETLTQANGNTLGGVTTSGNQATFGSVVASNNLASGFALSGNDFTARTITANGNTGYGLNFISCERAKIFGGSTSDNTTGGITATSTAFLKSFTINEAVEVAGQTSGVNNAIYSTNHDNTADNHRTFLDGGLISSDASIRKTASGISWKLQPTSTARVSRYPLSMSLAKVAVAANALVTIKAWMRRDNTGLTMRLVCKANQLAGIGSSDITSSMTAAADTWEELTITFTPTEVGVVEITAEAFGGTTYTGYVDDLTITQA